MREQHPRFDHIGRRDFLAVGAAGLALAGAPGLAAGQAKRSGEIAAGLSERMLTLDPANHYSISTTSVLRHLFDPLIDVTNDSKFIPALAETWRPVNNTTWRFTLRKGVTFHDGTPFNADSVVFTLEARPRQYQAHQVVRLPGHRVRGEGRRLRGHRHVQAALRLPARPSHDAGHAAAERGRRTRRRSSHKPIGTGPFRFASWTHGDQIAMTANPSYWKPGMPKVEKVTFRFIPELSTRTAALRAGELHVIDRVTPDLVETLKGTRGVKVLDVPAIEAQRWIFQLAESP